MLCPSGPSTPQAIIASAIRCYGAMLEVACQVAEPPEADSWRPLQEGFFAAFSTFCSVAQQFSASGQQPGGSGVDGARRWVGLSAGGPPLSAVLANCSLQQSSAWGGV